MVIGFADKHEVFIWIVAREPIVMGTGDYAGMKMSKILVMRFAARKRELVRILDGVSEERVLKKRHNSRSSTTL
jgi:hypothetical protein